MKGANMSNATAQMVTHPQVKPRKPLRLAIKKCKIYYRLALVIDAVFDFEDPESKGYDLDNSKPWPLGHYDTERQAIAQRNAMVMIDPRSTGDPKRDKKLLDRISISYGRNLLVARRFGDQSRGKPARSRARKIGKMRAALQK